mmetsp:Transcript_6110/g.9909  ORF Transcript_6110/g.9909 Transcript_6110/m.9909 type:complete len:853 (+) Transcript_6110:58-2616(+)
MSLAKFLVIVLVIPGCLSSRLRLATTNAKPDASKLGIALFGLTGDGKSSLCNWLSGSNDTCKVGDELESETSEVKVATIPWFGDPSQGEIVLADTPGISDTEGRDAKHWVHTVKTIKDGLRMLDAAILVVNFADERMTQDRRDMLSILRDSFGYDLWEHFAVVFTHFAWKTKDNRFGKTQEMLDKKATGWRTYFKALEEERGVVDDDHAIEIERAMQDIPFFAVELNSEIDGIISSSQPLAEHVDSGLTDVLGLPHLRALRDWVRQKHVDVGALDLISLRPRMGPGEVALDQSFECFYPLSCSIFVEGKHLSSQDQVRIIPESIACGSEHANGVVGALEFATQSTVEPPVNNAHFNLGKVKKAEGRFRVCYCEYGKCDIVERFAQDAGILRLDAVSCGAPQCPPNVGDYDIGADTVACDGVAGEVKYPNRITFHCQEGYAVAGKHEERSFTQECLETGVLTPASHGCERVRCGYAPPVPHAFPKSNAEVSYGELAAYECEASYTLTGNPAGEDVFALTCNADGQFSKHAVLPQGCRRWDTGKWSACSTDCGHGKQFQDVMCSTGADEDCEALSKPPIDRECESYMGCDGCADSTDCKAVTLNELLNSTGMMPSMLGHVLPTVSTSSVSPFTSCRCTEQCYHKGQRLISLGKSVDASDQIHDTCFYDHYAKACGCLHQQMRSGQTWKVVGGGLCQGADGNELRGGLAIENKRNEHELVIGDPPTLEKCKKVCIELGDCPGVYYTMSQTWVPILQAGTIFSGEARCLVYSSVASLEHAAELSQHYTVRILKGSAGAIESSTGSNMQKHKDMLGWIKARAYDLHAYLLDSFSGGDATSNEDLPGHCYKYVADARD